MRRKVEWCREFHFSFRSPCNAEQSSNVFGDARVVAIEHRAVGDRFEFGKVNVAVVTICDEGDFAGDRISHFLYPGLPTFILSLSGIASGNRSGLCRVNWQPYGLAGPQPACEPCEEQAPPRFRQL
jgi:hypothetical protein